MDRGCVSLAAVEKTVKREDGGVHRHTASLRLSDTRRGRYQLDTRSELSLACLL